MLNHVGFYWVFPHSVLLSTWSSDQGLACDCDTMALCGPAVGMFKWKEIPGRNMLVRLYVPSDIRTTCGPAGGSWR